MVFQTVKTSLFGSSLLNNQRNNGKEKGEYMICNLTRAVCFVTLVGTLGLHFCLATMCLFAAHEL